MPDHHAQRLEGLRAYWEKEAEKRADEERAGLQETEPATDDANKDEGLRKILSDLDTLAKDKDT
jgi:hypothetical protein